MAAPSKVGPPALPLAALWNIDVPGAPPIAAALSDGGWLVAGFADHVSIFSLATGEAAWTSPVPGLRLACATTLCVAGDQTMIRAIDLQRRAVRWQKPLAGPLAFAPTLRNGWVFVTTADGRVTALRDNDGSDVWTYAAGARLTGPPSVDGQQLAVATANRDVTLVDLRTGRALWTARTEAMPGAPRLGGGMVYVGTSNRELLFVDAVTGRIKSASRTGGGVLGPPALDDRFVYTSGPDGVLRAFDRGSGSLTWYGNLPTRPSPAGPFVDTGLAIVALHTGGFQAYLANGDGRKPAVLLAAPGAGDSTVNLAVDPLITGAGSTLRLVTISHSVGDFSKWSVAVTGTAPRLKVTGLPATVPGVPLKLTAPR
jgi:outer membrane protein assembly factor BamB